MPLPADRSEFKNYRVPLGTVIRIDEKAMSYQAPFPRSGEDNTRYHPAGTYVCVRSEKGTFGNSVWRNIVIGDKMSLWHSESYLHLHYFDLDKGAVILKVGDDTDPVPVRDYEESRMERETKRFKKFDQRYEGYTNKATYVAHVTLSSWKETYDMVKLHKRKDGTVNSGRFHDLMYKEYPAFFSNDDALFYHDFPATSDFYMGVNWEEIALLFAPKNKTK